MSDESKVWIRERTTKAGKTKFDLRWICPIEHKWKSRAVKSGDRKLADEEAALLRRDLSKGTYRPTSKTSWQAFVDDHVSKKKNPVTASDIQCTLDEFGKVCGIEAPHRATFSDVETYEVYLRNDADGHKPNKPGTIRKKLIHLHDAFKMGIRRNVLSEDPMESWQLEPLDKHEIRVLSADKESPLLDAARDMYGYQWWAFVLAALHTGGRRGELLALTWDRIDFDDSSMLFTRTKTRKDRRVPLTPELAGVLRRLQAQTLRDGGPFRSLVTSFKHRWPRTRDRAGCQGVRFHDLRATFVTRLLAASVELTTVAELCGHNDIETTRKYYAQVTDADRRAAIATIRNTAAG